MAGSNMALEFTQYRKRLVKPVVHHLLLFDVQHLEQRLVEQAPLVVITALVELPGFLQELQAGLDELHRTRQIVVSAFEPLRQALPLFLNGEQLGFELDLGTRRHAVNPKVDEIVLLYVKSMQFAGQLPMQLPTGSVVLIDRRSEVRTHRGSKRRLKADRGVVVFHCLFKISDVDVWAVAKLALLVATEEVGVLRTAAVHGVLQDHATIAAGFVAPTAEQAAL